MSEYFVGTTGSNSQTTFEALSTSEVLDDLGLNTTDSPTFSGVFLEGSGNTIFSVDGSNGRLFGVTDEVTGTVFSVNDAAGLPILEVESTAGYDKITIGEYGSDLLVLSGQTSAQITGSQIATQSWISDQGFSADTNYYLTGIEKSSNTLTYKVQGASDVSYTFGSNAFTSTTIPSAANDATITISAGTALGGGGNFTTDQSANETITINHDSISRSDTTESQSLAFGGTFTGIDSITSNAQGHITAENTVTYTLPTITSGDITGAFGADVVLYDSDGAIEATEFIGDVRGAISFKAQAAEAITKGEAVYISGVSGNTTVVALADANDATKMPAFGIAGETAGANNPVTVINFGELANLDTDTPNWDEGDELFVSTTAGGLTTTAPTSESSLLQKIAKVTKRHASTGSITVMGAGRTNAVPNLNEGRLFVGNSSNQAVADGTIHVDIANSRVGINDTTPSEKLDVSGNILVKPSAVASTHSGLLLGFNKYNSTQAGLYGATDGAVANSDGNLYISTRNVSAVNGAYISLGQRDSTTANDKGTINIVAGTYNTNSQTGDIFLRYGSGDVLALEGSTGNVGIGTTSPSSPLHIDGGSESEVLKIEADSNPYIRWVQNGTNVGFLQFTGGVGYLSNMGNGSFYFRTNNTDKMTITSSGDVGIGDTSPSYKLDVNGTLRAVGAATFDSSVTVAGDLTVNGTTTTINSTTISVDDKNIELGSVGTPTDTTADGGGITLKGATDKTINWVNSTSSWTSNQTFSAPNLTLTSLSNQSSEATALVINGSNVVGYRELGSNAFNSTSYLPLSGGTLTGDVDFGDSVKAKFGASDDLQIYHDGTHSYIHDNGTGDLRINSDNTIRIRKHDNESIATFSANGAVELYYDNSKKFETTSSGITVTGSIVKSGGTSSQFLKADGSVDSNTYLTTGSAASTYLPLSGGTLTGNVTFPSPDAINFAANSDTGESHGITARRTWKKSVATGYLQKLGYWNDTEGTAQLLITVGSETSGNSATSTYLWGGGFRVSGSTTGGSYARLLPLTDHNGHGSGPDTGQNDSYHVYIYQQDTGYTYGVAVAVPSSSGSKNLRVTVTELAGGNNFTDESSSSAILLSGITTYTDQYSLNTVNIKDAIYLDGDLTLTGLSNQASEATALMINGSNAVGTRELGSAAFSATSAFATAAQGTSAETAYNWGNHASAGYLTAHPTISAASSSDNSGRTYIQDILLDSNGHVTGITTATETVTDTNTTYTAGNGLALSGTTFKIDDPVNLSQLTESTDATDDKFLIWDESTSLWKYMTLDDLQDAIDTNTTYTLSSFGVTATAAELNKLDGVTATTAELNYTDGVTSNIQTQLDGKASSTHNHTLDSLSNVTITSNTSGEVLRWSGSAWINSTLSEAGIQASSTALTTSTTFGGDVSGTYNAIVVANDSHTHNANNLTGTTLASGVTASSLTSVGTITSGTWNGTVIDSDYIGGRLTKKISGDGTTTNFTVTHSFGTPRVMTQILDYGDNGTGATYEVINTTVKRSSDNAISVLFGTAPTSSEDYLVLMTEMPAIS